MATIEDQTNDMDQQRIDELQNQYFREKLATIDAKRLQEAREYLEHNRRSTDSSVERVQTSATATGRLRQEVQRA